MHSHVAGLASLLIAGTQNPRYETVAKLQQQYVFIPHKVKTTYLAFLLRTTLEDITVMVFAARCKYVSAAAAATAPAGSSEH